MESKSFGGLPWILALVCSIMAVFCALDAAREASEARKVRAEAVEKGYAEYYTGKDNTPKWRWIRSGKHKQAAE